MNNKHCLPHLDIRQISTALLRKVLIALRYLIYAISRAINIDTRCTWLRFAGRLNRVDSTHFTPGESPVAMRCTEYSTSALSQPLRCTNDHTPPKPRT